MPVRTIASSRLVSSRLIILLEEVGLWADGML